MQAVVITQDSFRYAAMLPELPPGTAVAYCTSQEEAMPHAAGAECALIIGNTYSGDFLAGAPRLRWLHALGAGLDAWLTPAVQARDIVLTNGRGANAPPVAEHAVAMMMCLARRLHHARDEQSAGNWVNANTGGGLWGRELDGATLLVIGLGEIGYRVAAKGRALGMHVIGMRKGTDKPDAVDRLVPLAALDQVLPECDFIAVCAPLNPETEHLLGSRQFELIKPGAYLVNVGRGPVIDQQALLAALRNGRLAGAGLDVFEEEPLPAGDPLWQEPNVLITPHTGFTSPHTRPRQLAIWVENLWRFHRGEPLKNQIDKYLGY